MDDPYADLMEIMFTRPDSVGHRHEPFPLTDIQHAYLLGRHPGLELGGVSSHTYFEFDCPGLDLDRLSSALRKVIERHDMLRAVSADNEQRVLSLVPAYEIATTDLRDASEADQRAALARTRDELRDEVRPTDRWPLFEVRATVLADDRVRLHLSVDLLFVDLRGVFLVLDEWWHCYTDETFRPDPVGVSFRDCVRAPHEWGKDADREYWLSRVDELPAAPDLPLATAPERLGRPAFARLSTTLPRESWRGLTATAGHHGLSQNAVLLTAYCDVLRTWSSRPEFTVTLTRLDRLPSGTRPDGVVGNFLSLSLFAAPATGGTFAERAAALQRRLDEDLAHARFGGIEVLRELARKEGRNVPMPVVFSSTLGSVPGGDALHRFGEPVHAASQTPQIWLENQLVEERDALVVNWNSVAGLFPEGTLPAMFEAYSSLLHRLAADPDAWEQVTAVPLPARDRDEQDRANATASDLPAVRLHDLVAGAARRTPDAVAVVADGVAVTYRQLTEDAHRLARRLRDNGAEPNTVVAVSMRPGAPLIAALLGVLHAGAAYVSIDPDLPEQRRLKLVQRCRASTVVTEPELRARPWPSGVDVVTPADTQRYAAEPVDSPQGVDDLAYVIFTSGSTGEPKGVMISHRAAGNTVQDINQRFRVGPADRVLALAPTGFDLSVYDVFGVLGAGGTVVVPSPGRTNDVGHWTELVDRHGVTIWNSVPAPMRLWIESLHGTHPATGSTVRLALLSGDWIPTTLPGRIHARFPELAVISLGGATEASIWSVHHPIREVAEDWASIPYGKPLANQTLHVYDDRLRPCPAWVTGEIYIGGTGVALGYWDDPQRTGERFVVHPDSGERLYRTGDLGRYLPGGDIEILGRIDFQVKINGYRVELGEIESVLSQQPGIRQALVAAPVYQHTGQRQLAAYLVVDEPAAAEPEALRASLGAVLPGYMVPNHYVTLDALPLTTNGKIDHAALPAPWNSGVEEDRRVAPHGDVEERLVRIWSAQLGHAEFGVEDGFFDIGGDSLHAVAIVGQMRLEFGFDSVAEQEVIERLFMNTTIAEFADALDSLVEGHGEAAA